MDDISVSRALAYGPAKPDRSPYASLTRPSSLTRRSTGIAEPAAENRIAATERLATAIEKLPIRYTLLVLKSNEVFEVNRYRIDGNVLMFEQVDGTRGAVDLDQVDWRKTTEGTSLARSIGIAGSSTN